ncbi:MAG: hypothetical protein RBR32_11565 [Bacteroidales bacterium]|nr:hypothetical protein [Bacteroidales bacterium]
MNKKLYYPKPLPYKKEVVSIEEIEKLRKIDCVFYSNCLDHAVVFNYKNFHCKECNDYIRDPDYIQDAFLSSDSKKCMRVIQKILAEEE